MEEPVLLEWIDLYLMGSIRPEDKTELERMMAADPEIAELVKESQLAFNVLQSERNQLLRKKLKALDKEETRRSGFLPKRIILSACILVVIGGSWCWASYYFSNKAIAVRYFKISYPPEEETSLSAEMKTIWKEADHAFKSEDYGRAHNLYDSILENKEHPISYGAQWNLLMSNLALHGQTDHWKKELETFSQEASAPFRNKAQALSRLLDASWYKIIITLTQTDISGLKPRLI